MSGEPCELSASDWLAAWEALPDAQKEAYFHPLYARAQADWLGAEPECVALGSGPRRLLYAYLKQPVGGRFDVQTPYGYGGPLFIGNWNDAERDAALDAVGRRLARRGAVAEFVRCHPAWQSAEWFRAYKVFQVRTNVESEVRGRDETTLDADWSPLARRNLRIALRHGLTVAASTAPNAWREFSRLYRATAERLSMPAFYRFDETHFDTLARLSALTIVSVADAAGNTLAAAILLFGGAFAYYHLGGSDEGSLRLRPNHLLYWGMAREALRRNCQRICWGGGLSNDPRDSLYGFKSQFGSIRTPVYGAGRVLDAAEYGRLCAEWDTQHPDKVPANRMFLRYRA